MPADRAVLWSGGGVHVLTSLCAPRRDVPALLVDFNLAADGD